MHVYTKTMLGSISNRLTYTHIPLHMQTMPSFIITFQVLFCQEAALLYRCEIAP